MWRAGLIFFLALGACTQFPELDETVGPEAEAADYPALVPLEPILAEAAAAPERNAQTEDALEARTAALRARAAGLRQGVVDDETQERMKRGVAGG